MILENFVLLKKNPDYVPEEEESKQKKEKNKIESNLQSFLKVLMMYLL